MNFEINSWSNMELYAKKAAVLQYQSLKSPSSIYIYFSRLLINKQVMLIDSSRISTSSEWIGYVSLIRVSYSNGTQPLFSAFKIVNERWRCWWEMHIKWSHRWWLFNYKFLICMYIHVLMTNLQSFWLRW